MILRYYRRLEKPLRFKKFEEFTKKYKQATNALFSASIRPKLFISHW
jgi:hypothetical protein